jgi:hypothetical protein
MNSTNTDKIKQLTEAFLTLGKEGYTLTIQDERIAKLDRIAKRSKYGFKNEFYTRFKDENRMLEYCLEWYNNKIANETREVERKAKQKLQKTEGAKNVQVGDIFCYSWGWEQTNLDFYQVTEKKTAATIKVRPIYFESVETTSWASENVKPVANDFRGDEFTVRLNGDSFKRSCGSANKIDKDEDRTFYRSWYA